MKSTYILYDRRRLEFAVPDAWQILEPQDPPEIPDPDRAIRAALDNPIGCEPLGRIAERGDKSRPAVIVVSDITRTIPNEAFVPHLIEVLKESGYRDDQIHILIATGMHRPSTHEEHLELLGPELLRRYRVIDHRANAPEELTPLPNRTSRGTRVSVNTVYVEAGLRILTGFVEPHFMAGFSGGRKSICPGLVDLETLQLFHGAKILGDPGSRIGQLENNPCHQEALEVARMVRPDFLFNVTVNSRHKITGIFAGDMEQAHLAGTEYVRKTLTVRVDQPFDAIFTSAGGYPLDTTFYQTGKGMVIGGEFVKPGGKVVTASGCRYGFGSDSYETILKRYRDYKIFLDDIHRNNATELDQWGFQMQARILDKIGLEGLILVCDHMQLTDLRCCHVTPAVDLVGLGGAEDQITKLVALFSKNDQRVAVLPRGPYVLPEVLSR